MSMLRIESTRSGHVESVHTVSVTVVDAGGRLVASAGRPGLVTFWRSAAKPFQSLPLVADGAADRFGYGTRELALACASHSSEPVHLEVVDGMLRRAELDEASLACGPHPPLSPEVAERVVRERVTLSPRWSNCSGKHTGMLAAARHAGLPLEGYAWKGHPLQERILDEVARWSGHPRGDILQVVDGCTAVCFGLPLTAMATAYARFGTTAEPPMRRLREAMVAHPELVAGTGRLCTELMSATRGGVVAKVGAEGVYSAAVPALGLGVALKVEDGDGRCAPPALLFVLRALLTRADGQEEVLSAFDGLQHHAEPVLRNTRGERVGSLRPAGALAFA